jgi:S-methylmethionine-dependent homocysteine/selenocysteine methylase/SAM-dependent methyltransferase
VLRALFQWTHKINVVMATILSPAYQRIQERIANDECIILDGGTATELERMRSRDFQLSDNSLWGTWGLYHAPYEVLRVHKNYVAAGADIITTNTWGIVNAPEMEMRSSVVSGATPTHWMDIARLGIRLARQAIIEGDRKGKCALAFSLNGDIESQERQHTLELLTRVFEEEPPDIILMETLSLIRGDITFSAVEMMLETGLPVFLSFRRCRHGVCGVYGQHWGGPEGDLFGRAARRFEKMGVGALMINCLPIDHVPGMLPWLRDFTDLPLGVYPNLGRYMDPGWQADDTVGPEDYAQLALQWREEGAQIIGGCCGVNPDHIAAVHKRLAGVKSGGVKSAPLIGTLPEVEEPQPPVELSLQPWRDNNGRPLYPLQFPDIVVEPGVFRPTQGSFLVWKYLFTSGLGKGKRCLDIGCGSGILAVQLALNGAKHVHAFDLQERAIRNTLSNAFRNGAADRVTARAVDLYTFQPDEKFDIIVASLYQMPVDPMGAVTGHRPVDFWGRNLLDHLIRLLPLLLADDGAAYLMQISILGQLRTAELLDQAGFVGKVVDFAFFHFSPVFYENIEQIKRVEQMSDAYHLQFGEDDVMVMYLIEAKRKR